MHIIGRVEETAGDAPHETAGGFQRLLQCYMQLGRTGAPRSTLSPAMTSPSPTIRYTKRLADKILVAFHHACDQRSYRVAWQLLHVLEVMAMRKSFIPADARRIRQSLVAAHERLWQFEIWRMAGAWGCSPGKAKAFDADAGSTRVTILRDLRASPLTRMDNGACYAL